MKKLLELPPLQLPGGAPAAVSSPDDPNRLTEEIEKVIPDSPQRAYDMKRIIRQVADHNDFFEIQEDFAKNIIIGFIRLGGASIGVIANQPMVSAGSLDIDASDKSARFIRFCDAFNIPILNLVDCPGYLPGKNQEYGGIIRHGAKTLYAYCEAVRSPRFGDRPEDLRRGDVGDGGLEAGRDGFYDRADDGGDRDHGSRGGGERDFQG